ncbi:MAG TPA: RIP metalloprotease RseP, partial [Gemmatimonadaceae bacterium]
HFLAAKATGVYAPRFSIGFGPSIFKFRRGETEYILAWLPLGGYVRMASRHDAETAFLEGGNEEGTAKNEVDPDFDPNAMIPFGPKPVPENRWFESKPLWARIFIMIAGVVMNILLAIVVATVLVMRQGQNIVSSTVVGAVQATPATQPLSQLHLGDTIRSVNGKTVATWNDVQREVVHSDRSVRFVTQRDTVTVPLSPNAAEPVTGEDIAESIVYFLPPVIDSIVAGDPASIAGMERGDSVIAIDGAPIRGWNEMVEKVSRSPGQKLQFLVARAGAIDTIYVTPKRAAEPDPATPDAQPVGKIGAAAKSPAVHRAIPFGEGLSYGFKLTWTNAGAVFKVLHDIGSGQQSVRQLGGPIAITRAAVDAARNGIDVLFQLIALLSINVAVLNLLPIPILDGGQILINVLESVKGSPFSMRTREYILRFGLFAIALLFVIVMYNDTRAGFVKLFGWVGRLFGA